MKTITYALVLTRSNADDFEKKMMNLSQSDLIFERRPVGTNVNVTFIDSLFQINKAVGVVVFISGELAVRNRRLTDYSILLTSSSSTFHYQTRRVLGLGRGPYLPKDETLQQQLKTKFCSEELRQQPKTKFCNFVYEHSVTFRNNFAKQLSKYKKVDCAGLCLNNVPRIGKEQRNKLNFICHYKFTIAFEHTSFPGYSTEKIFDAFLVNSVPIYYGDPEITRDINPKSFINVSDFPTINDAIEYICKVDSDPNLYASYKNAEALTKNSFIKKDTKENITKFYIRIGREFGTFKPAGSFLANRIYRRIYTPISLLHLIVAHTHVEGASLKDQLKDWKAYLTFVLVFPKKLAFYLIRKSKSKKIYSATN